MREAIFERAYPLALRAAQVRARAAVACGLIQPVDFADAVQEGLFASWRELARFDPSRASLPTFIEIVAATRIASFVRASHRHRVLCPLDNSAEQSADPPLARLVVRIDVQRVLAGCTETERRLARTLMEHSPTQASRLLGIARSTLHERTRKLRPRFVAAGLGPGGHTFSPEPATRKGGIQ